MLLTLGLCRAYSEKENSMPSCRSAVSSRLAPNSWAMSKTRKASRWILTIREWPPYKRFGIEVIFGGSNHHK